MHTKTRIDANTAIHTTDTKRQAHKQAGTHKQACTDIYTPKQICIHIDMRVDMHTLTCTTKTCYTHAHPDIHTQTCTPRVHTQTCTPRHAHSECAH